MKNGLSARTELIDQFSQGNWSPDLISRSLHLASSASDALHWFDYLNISHAIQGLAEEQWQLAVECGLSRHASSPALLLQLQNLIATPGLLTDVDERRRAQLQLRLQQSIGQRRMRSAACLSALRHSGYLGSRIAHYPCLAASRDLTIGGALPWWSRLSPKRDQAMRLAKRSSSLSSLIEELLQEEGHERAITMASAEESRPGIMPSITDGVGQSPIRLAVVGNSPTILESCEGERIDSADLVIRFNNARIDTDKVAHTGSRTDIWVMSAQTPVSQCPADARAVLISGLQPLTRPSLFWPRLPSLERRLSVCPAAVWYELVARFRAPPTAGTLLLASLRSLSLDVSCHGFTREGRDHLHQRNHLTDNRPRSSRHNWQAEAHWLGEFITQRKTLVLAGK